MSRGLSKNQRRILGIAYSINTCFGCEVDKTGNDMPGYVCRVSDYDGIKDIHWAIVANKLFRLPWLQHNQQIQKSNGYYQSGGYYFDLTTKEAKSAKVSSIRAITSLMKNDYLLYAPNRTPFTNGYVLTEKGMNIGRECREPIAHWEILRGGFVTNYTYSYDGSSIPKLADVMKISDISLQQVTAEYKKEQFKNSGFIQNLLDSVSVTIHQNSAER